MSKSFSWWTRKLHRWGAVATAIPLLLVIVSGLLLQLKKEIPWVQPPTQRGSSQTLTIDWSQILSAAKSDSNTQIAGWDDIDRLDVRPSKGLVKVRCKNGWEVQLDSANGEILSSAYRRSDLIESLHDGSFFSDEAKLWIFLPNGILLFALWGSGLYLWYLPRSIKAAKRAKANKKQKQSSATDQ